MTKLDLEKLTLFSAALLVLLAGALIVRGGGFGIAELSWNTELVVTRSNLRVGPITVLEGDRIHSVNSRPVNRDADIRGVLRTLEADEIWLEVERIDYRVAVPLTPEAIEADELPAILRGPYQVIRIDGREVEGDMNLAVMASWMEMNGNRPAVFTVSVPDYSFEGPARRVRRPGPVLPVVLLVFTLGAVVLAWIRGRDEVMTRPREHWHLLGIGLAAGGVFLAFLFWHDGFMADPVLLPFGLVALCVWRPLSLFHHQARRGRFTGPTSIYFRVGIALPASILLLAALYGWTRTLSDLSGSPLDGFVYDQLHLLILVGAVFTALYHLTDMGLHVAGMRNRHSVDPIRQAPPWIGSILASLFIVAAIVGLSTDVQGFANGGYVPFLAGLVGLQWLGDLALLPRRSQMTAVRPQQWQGPALHTVLTEAADALNLAKPQYVCRFHETSIALSLATRSDENADEKADEDAEDISDDSPSFVFEQLDEPLAGLLELLDAEGGMFPRYKTIRGIDESNEDPFDGLDRAVGVELVLPLQPPPNSSGPSAMRAYLVSRQSTGANVLSDLPSAEAIEIWQRHFTNHPETWSRLRATAAEGALDLVNRHPQEQLETSVDEPDDDHEVELARFHVLQRDADVQHPTDEPDIIDEAMMGRLPTFASSRGSMVIRGQMGTGRQFIARLVHDISESSGAFVALDCSSLPEALVLPELLGEGNLPGRLTAAENGTLCIRDLSRLSRRTQDDALAAVKPAPVKLILIETVHASKSAAPLPAAVRRAVDEAVLDVPPLSQRPEAIERAAQFYLHRFAMTLGRVVTSFSDEAVSWLKDQHWPGNYFDLIACIRTAVIRCEGEQIAPTDLGPGQPLLEDTEDLAKTIEHVERESILKALDQAGGNKSQAARLVGMKRTTFIRKLAKYAPDR